jgi:hypothetical protein
MRQLTKKQFYDVIHKRARNVGERAVGKYAIPLGSDLAMVNTDALTEATDRSAVFCITDNSVDRDGDRVNPLGVRLDQYRRSGAPVYFGHAPSSNGGHPYPIGSCINPVTKSFDVWPEQDRITARIHFDVDGDAVARFIARKVALRQLSCVSIAFIPLRATHRDSAMKAQPWQRPDRNPAGFDYHETELTELSVVQIPSNKNAILLDAPPAVAKALRRCFGPNCGPTVAATISKMQADLDSPGIPGRETKPAAEAAGDFSTDAFFDSRPVALAALVRHNDRARHAIARALAAQEDLDTDSAIVRALLAHEKMLASSCADLVAKLDALPVEKHGGSARDEILERYSPPDEGEESISELLNLYRFPAAGIGSVNEMDRLDASDDPTAGHGSGNFSNNGRR